MVEVPLEIEAELPREFDGAALLASSGLPRKVKIKAQRDALKLSTAYRADQLMADIVRVALRGTPQDAARVQEATRAFIRTVRERRQDGATLLVSSNGRGKIEVLEQLPERAPKARPTPISEPPPLARPKALEGSLADRLAGVEKRLAELESGFARMAANNSDDRLSQLEERLGMLQSRTDLAGPMIEAHAGAPATMELSRTPGAPRRTTAVEAFAEGLRSDLRARVTEQLQHAERAARICDKAAALAAEAETLLGAPHDGTAQRMQLTAAAAAARMAGLARVAEEIDLYQAADLGIAAQLVSRLEDGPARVDTPDPATPLQLQAEALVRAARGPDAAERAGWLRRAAALCGWALIEPEVGGSVQPDLAQFVTGGSGGSSVVAVASPGLRRNDGSVLVRARVLASVAETADEEVEVLATSGAGESDVTAAPHSAPTAPTAPSEPTATMAPTAPMMAPAAPALISTPAPEAESAPPSGLASFSHGELARPASTVETGKSADPAGSSRASMAADAPEFISTLSAGMTAPQSQSASERAAIADERDGSISASQGAAKPEPGKEAVRDRAEATCEPRPPHASDASTNNAAGPGEARDAGATSARSAEATYFGDLAGSGQTSPDQVAAAAAQLPAAVGKETSVQTAPARTLATEGEVGGNVTDPNWALVARGPDASRDEPGKAAAAPPLHPVEEDNYEVSDADVEEIEDFEPDPRH